MVSVAPAGCGAAAPDGDGEATAEAPGDGNTAGDAAGDGDRPAAGDAAGEAATPGEATGDAAPEGEAAGLAATAVGWAGAVVGAGAAGLHAISPDAARGRTAIRPRCKRGSCKRGIRKACANGGLRRRAMRVTPGSRPANTRCRPRPACCRNGALRPEWRSAATQDGTNALPRRKFTSGKNRFAGKLAQGHHCQASHFSGSRTLGTPLNCVALKNSVT